MEQLTEEARKAWRTKIDEAERLYLEIGVAGRALRGAPKAITPLSDDELVKAGACAELVIPLLQNVKQWQTDAKVESSLFLKSLYSMGANVALWAANYDENVVREKLFGYPLEKFLSVDKLRTQLREDITGNLFWDKYLKAGVMTCALVGAAAIVISTAGVAAPVMAFLTAQFTAAPTIATAIGAGAMLAATSAVMWIDNTVHQVFGKKSSPPKGKPETPTVPQKPAKAVTVQQDVQVGTPVTATGKTDTLHKKAASHGRTLGQAGTLHTITSPHRRPTAHPSRSAKPGSARQRVTRVST